MAAAATAVAAAPRARCLSSRKRETQRPGTGGVSGPRAMDSMVEENGSVVDPLAQGSQSGETAPNIVTSVQSQARIHNQQQQQQQSSQQYLQLASTSIVQLDAVQVQSVIQPNQQSVIQTATNIQPVSLSKGNVILVKPNSVIQTAQGGLQTLQVVETDDDGSSEEESPKRRRDMLSRRPSYRKILSELGGGEITGLGVADNRMRPIETSSEYDSNVDSEVSSHSLPYPAAGSIQLAQGEGVPGLHTLNMSNSTTAGGTIVQYAQGPDAQFFVPASTGPGVVVEDAARKREQRLMKNREAARECRRKKKEYIKCLENRVSTLEMRNQTLMDELKSLKELYQQKTD
ncbi:cyclic AMP-responsive element-binding protein 1 isoform X3 [Trichogramma pretiosum]|uniref:cyclic AMP-responsive element-binding protein 1 isoform X3 n=1 Tax=Trichogramma pretiosum TaxID=7493 RepID=UPI000C71BB6B|nr:cyclic AMP-responsive element-binding protein 1 isoform X3 [Trichogramma pretiosum]